MDAGSGKFSRRFDKSDHSKNSRNSTRKIPKILGKVSGNSQKFPKIFAARRQFSKILLGGGGDSCAQKFQEIIFLCIFRALFWKSARAASENPCTFLEKCTDFQKTGLSVHFSKKVHGFSEVARALFWKSARISRKRGKTGLSVHFFKKVHGFSEAIRALFGKVHGFPENVASRVFF